MKVVAIVNHKGGVGKTTTAFNFAAGLARRNKSVLLIDFDMQGNLSDACGIEVSDEASIKDSISDMMDEFMKDEELSYVVKTTDFEENLDIIPCGIKMSKVMIGLNSVMGRERCLSIVLNQIKTDEAYRNYDYCIIDCAPSIMVDFENAIYAADEILIVANPDKFSAGGMATLMTQFNKIRTNLNRPDLKVAGVLLNNVDERTKYTKTMLKIIKDSYDGLGVFETIIPSSIRVKESLQMHLPMMDYEPENPVAKAYEDLVSEYLRKEGRYDFS